MLNKQMCSVFEVSKTSLMGAFGRICFYDIMIIVIYIYNVNNERYLFFWFDFPEYYLIFVHSDTKVIIGFFNIPI